MVQGLFQQPVRGLVESNRQTSSKAVSRECAGAGQIRESATTQATGWDGHSATSMMGVSRGGSGSHGVMMDRSRLRAPAATSGSVHFGWVRRTLRVAVFFVAYCFRAPRFSESCLTAAGPHERSPLICLKKSLIHNLTSRGCTEDRSLYRYGPDNSLSRPIGVK